MFPDRLLVTQFDDLMKGTVFIIINCTRYKSEPVYLVLFCLAWQIEAARIGSCPHANIVTLP